jgi:hypothetical protein
MGFGTQKYKEARETRLSILLVIGCRHNVQSVFTGQTVNKIPERSQYTYRKVHQSLLGAVQRFESSLELVKRIHRPAGVHRRGGVVRSNQIPLIARIEVILRSGTDNVGVWKR